VSVEIHADTHHIMSDQVVIVRATTAESDALTGIAFAAKRHWGYPEEWIESWRELLTIRPEVIATHEMYVATSNDARIGFYGLEPKSGKVDLLHMWVLPRAMGQGVGRRLLLHAVERTRQLGFRMLEIESDPNAERFYLRMGARRVGTRVSESQFGRRELPILSFNISEHNVPRSKT